jgi:FAD/FMN-containing dehydrogenase
MTVPMTSDWSALQAAIAGQVVLPSSPDYDSARKPAISRFDDIRPKAVVRCWTPEDVAETISFAERSGLRTATRSGGHCFAGRSSCEGIVIDVRSMNRVVVSTGTALIGAGACLGDVYEALKDHDLTLPAGSCPTVGIAGLTLGGGLGILGRKYGLSADQLLAAQVVLGDGRVADCNADHHEDLFWALRGSGAGTLGVVTSFVFRTRPALPATNFHLTWPLSHAAAVIAAWQAWAPAAPDEMYGSLLATAEREVERPPVLNLFGSMLGSEQDTAELLDDLIVRAGADSATDFRKFMSREETTRYWAALGAEKQTDQDEPRKPAPREYALLKSEFFRQPLPREAITALLANLADGRSPDHSRELDFTPWGGAYNRIREDATAFAHRRELFSLKHAAVVDADSARFVRDAAQSWVTNSWKTVRPWGSGRVFPNFPDPDLEDWRHAYYGANYERLLRVKTKYDPRNAFRFHQSLPSTV